MNLPESEPTQNRPARKAAPLGELRLGLTKLGMSLFCTAVVTVVINPLAAIKAVLVGLFFLYFALGELPRQAQRIARQATAAAEALDRQPRFPCGIK